MRTVTCSADIPHVPAHVLHAAILSDDLLRDFHGPDTQVDAWENGTRSLRFRVDTTGSPIPLGSRLWTDVRQTWRPNGIANSMKLAATGILGIQSVWTVTDGHVAAEANVSVFAPLAWIAEPFVARKASTQMRAFIEAVRERCRVPDRRQSVLSPPLEREYVHREADGRAFLHDTVTTKLTTKGVRDGVHETDRSASRKLNVFR